MDDLNVAVVCGTVTSEPRTRELPSGSTVTQVEVSTRLDDGTCSVPIVVVDAAVTVGTGDQVVAVGRVVRRFFRAGGVTQSRTELVATKLVRASNRRSVERALRLASDELVR
ncbi:MAG: hypothetical protein CL424_10980 [Acidimicrobiaceae bacterium]|nr:hypothetical protein [Acidimicrobiaceae bacterium]